MKKNIYIQYWYITPMGAKENDIYVPDMDYYISLDSAFDKGFKEHLKSKQRSYISVKIKSI